MLWGNSHTSYTVGNALSYSNSVGNASFQVDAIMDSARDTGDAVDQVEFGMSIGLGDIGKLAVSYVEKKDTNIMTMMHVEGDSGRPQINAVPAMYTIPDPEDAKKTLTVKKVNVYVTRDTSADDSTDSVIDAKGMLETGADNKVAESTMNTFLDNIHRSGNTYFYGGAAPCMEEDDVKAGEEKCGMVTVYVRTVTTIGDDTTADDTDNTDGQTITTTVNETYYLEDAANVTMVAGTGIAAQTAMPYKPASTTSTADIKPGSKSTHIAAEFGIGGVTAYLGHSKTETNGGAIMMGDNVNSMTGGVVDETMTTKATDTKVTHAGVRGSVGDGGMNYLVQYRSVDAAGAKSSPFLIHLNKSLGDGATAIIEHANNDDGVSGLTWVGLKVDF